jgi:hypothetical protein
LSIFVPEPIRVSPTAGRSTVALAPISTSSSTTTRPDLRNLFVRAIRPPRETVAITADDGAVLHDDAPAERHVLAN